MEKASLPTPVPVARYLQIPRLSVNLAYSISDAKSITVPLSTTYLPKKKKKKEISGVALVRVTQDRVKKSLRDANSGKPFELPNHVTLHRGRFETPTEAGVTFGSNPSAR